MERIKRRRTRRLLKMNSHLFEENKHIRFGSIPRFYSKDGIVITEKLDGMNAVIKVIDNELICGSRNMWLDINTIEDPMLAKFYQWVERNYNDLLKLGPGSHHGEWWGKGFERNYNLKNNRFSLFNTNRWNDINKRPQCCHVVPTLYEGPLTDNIVKDTLLRLSINGSYAKPEFKNPEGIVIYHKGPKQLYKVTLDKNDCHKWEIPQYVKS